MISKIHRRWITSKSWAAMKPRYLILHDSSHIVLMLHEYNMTGIWESGKYLKIQDMMQPRYVDRNQTIQYHLYYLKLDPSPEPSWFYSTNSAENVKANLIPLTTVVVKYTWQRRGGRWCFQWSEEVVPDQNNLQDQTSDNGRHQTLELARPATPSSHSWSFLFCCAMQVCAKSGRSWGDNIETHHINWKRSTYHIFTWLAVTLWVKLCIGVSPNVFGSIFIFIFWKK